MPQPARRSELRVTDRERERAADVLRRSCAEGAIGFETLESRLALAYGAQTVEELDRTTRDLPNRWRRLAMKVEHTMTRVESLLDFGGAPAGPDEPLAPGDRAQLPRLTPPPGRDSFVVGRDRRCTVVFDEPTVSREHAMVRCDYTESGLMRWRIADLGSTNGTWVDGRRVEHALLRAGDLVALGHLQLMWEAPPHGHTLDGYER